MCVINNKTEPKIETAYCIMCLGDYDFVMDKDDELVCENCGTGVCSGISDRDFEIEAFTKHLKKLGYSDAQIARISNGDEVGSPCLIEPANILEELQKNIEEELNEKVPTKEELGTLCLKYCKEIGIDDADRIKAFTRAIECEICFKLEAK